VDREAWFDQIAASILEGSPVDWSAVEFTAGPDDQAVLRQLRILAEVAALHRDLPPAPSAPRGEPPATGPAPAGGAARAVPAAFWGHLRLLQSVGRGSYGEVYRAWDAHLDREVALKLLRAAAPGGDASFSLSDPSRVVHEGRLLARVRHPHVITVYGAEPRDGSVGIWMEFIRGTTLHDLVERQGRLGAREAAAIGIDLCRAVAAVHEAGLLHRDISARNVMREDGGRIVLMDFGAGYEELATGGATGVTGTPLYMAPELFAGGQATQRSDLYALGTLLFYLVTARYPVFGRSLADVRAAHARGDRTRLRDLRADLPAAFVNAIEQAIDPDPRRRFRTSGEMEAALHALEDRAGLHRAARRSRLLAAGAIGALAVAVAGLITYEAGKAGSGAPGGGAQAAAALSARRVDAPAGIWVFSNPSDDGRFAAGMVNETGDAAFVDLVTGDYRPMGIGFSQDDGYASLGALSPDGTAAAIDYHNDRGGNLYVVRRDGSRPRMLSEAPVDVSPYQWSRDGTMILSLIERPDQPGAIALVAASDGAVRVVGELDGSTPTHMALSPDNRYIAYDAPERPGAVERDIFILDAHTGQRWVLEASPGGDVGPFWTPDGTGLVFLSDRNRYPSLWFASVAQGRLQGEAHLLKDGVGRVHLRGFTAARAMHYDLAAGFAEVYVAAVDGATAGTPQTLSPRRAVSNFYPRWSPDGRYVAYGAERSDLNSTRAFRELWIYDAATGSEARVPFDPPIGLPLGWSPDSREVLVGAGRALHVVNRESGQSRIVASAWEGRAAWGPAGILFTEQGQVVLADSAGGRRLRAIGPAKTYSVSPDGRSAIARLGNGRLALVDPATGATRVWTDPVEWVGVHFTPPHTAGVGYMAGRKGVNGDVRSLMYWPGSGEPRELLRIDGKERFILAGWLPDDRTLLASRWQDRPTRLPDGPAPATLWRIPISGQPVSTGLTMDGLRDISIHPGGRQVAFNAGWKRGEAWVMEHVLPQ
jgi:serine/threonine-protein kinase